MLFNTHLFLLGFLPAAIVCLYLTHRSEVRRSWTLIGVSLVFYGWWDVRLVPLLVGGVLANAAAARLFFSTGKRWIPIAAIAANLAVLGCFKYTNFLIGTIQALLDPAAAPSTLDIVLPLGISFFTFHHIIYLADCLAKRAPRYSLRNYALYIVLFPQILAGPLVRHTEIVHQFREDPWRAGVAERWSRGLVLLTIGLAKKILLADPLARIAEPLFHAAAFGQALSLGDGWLAATAFTFQIYFDFSGYSDMAIGIALLLGFVLPVNFDAPYRSLSLQDFWRRWHMTLSRFLRDYLYVPLGGNRHGLVRQLGALTATMLLGGLWHGAAWTFVIWGGVHGIGLAANALWRRQPFRLPPPIAWVLTFVFVAVVWVFFRAPSFDAAASMLKAMAGLSDLTVHGGAAALDAVSSPHRWRLIAVAALIAIAGPTSQRVSLDLLKPIAWPALATAAVMLLLLFRLGAEAGQQFIYFQF